jgi:hypothetical protein
VTQTRETYGSITGLIRATVDDRDQAGGVVFTDSDLLPFVNASLRDLNVDLIDIGSPLALKQTMVTLDATTDTTLDFTVATPGSGALLPSDMFAPRQLHEKLSGDPIQNYVEMDQTAELLPDVLATDRLRYWIWINNQIQTLGATSNRDVRITYYFYAPLFTQASDAVPFAGAGNTLAYHGLYKCAISRGDQIAAEYAKEEYDKAWDQFKRLQIHAKQWRPRRRFPYGQRSYRWWSIFLILGSLLSPTISDALRAIIGA